ncbi:hypothetical protein DM02DRAFT_662083 [Periconia macrospinosa]|uniref:Uncharacterized protein n=1 Tax=Periconia macrospinosa TaxID=97972 RepID=A0A2V1D7T8_9PLEO|nr:hypothetical protein DM02DRAFT_662083 [Periconia macrospinosa]
MPKQQRRIVRVSATPKSRPARRRRRPSKKAQEASQSALLDLEAEVVVEEEEEEEGHQTVTHNDTPIVIEEDEDDDSETEDDEDDGIIVMVPSSPSPLKRAPQIRAEAPQRAPLTTTPHPPQTTTPSASDQRSTEAADLRDPEVVIQWKSYRDSTKHPILKASHTEQITVLLISRGNMERYIQQTIDGEDGKVYYKEALYTITYEGQRGPGRWAGVIRREDTLWDFSLQVRMENFVKRHPDKPYMLIYDVFFKSAVTAPSIVSSTPRGRGVATQIQEEGLSSVLHSEVVTGNQGALAINDRWNCKQENCRNYPGVCYIQQKGNVDTDDWRNHLPLNGTILNLWNGEILRGLSTIEAPSIRIQHALRVYKHGKEKKEKPLSSEERIRQLLELSIVRELSKSSANPPSPFTPAPAPPDRASSPIEYEEEDPLNHTREFFLWWATREGSGLPVEEYEEKLLHDQWLINELSDQKNGLT